MDVLWWILIAVAWIAIAFWPARVAGRKGHGFFGYFVFSLFFFPAAVIVAYLVEDRTESAVGQPPGELAPQLTAATTAAPISSRSCSDWSMPTPAASTISTPPVGTS